ncbi:MAG: hypothetical protein HYZ28_20525 [Myxococcales bacterium]|nr:hypothetical protein [Myxococcales bacterium]
MRLIATLVLLAVPAAAAQEGMIPPHLAAELGIPQEKVRKVRDLAFEANEALIPLEAELKKAQLSLERQLQSDSPEEAQVEKWVEAVSRAETAVRKNRIGLMLKVRKVLGSEIWHRLEAMRQEERRGMPDRPPPPRPPEPPRPPSP